MATQLTIHFAQHGTRPSQMPVLKKLYALSATQFIVKHTKDGADELIDYNLSNLDFRAFPGGILKSPNFDKNNFKVATMEGSDLHVVFDTPIPASEDVPETLTLELDESAIYPHFIYQSSDETATVETTTATKPSWLKHRTRRSVADDLNARVAAVAHRFAEGYSYSWAYLNTQYETIDGIITVNQQSKVHEIEAVKRRDITANWARLLIGYVCRQVDRFKGQNNKQTYTQITDLVELLESQIPNKYTVQEFHNRIDTDEWIKRVANDDKKPGREIWTRKRDYTRDKKLYDINDANKQNNVLDSDAAKAEYIELINSYVEAFEMPHAEA